MQVHVETRESAGQPLRDLAVQRVKFAMRRLSWLVPRARVLLADVNGPRGGVDKRCQLELKTSAGGTVVITAMSTEWRDALDQALARAARVLTRRWQRARNHRAPGVRERAVAL